MQTKALLHFGLIGCIGLLCLCGKVKKVEVVYGPDSLNIEKIRAIMAPDTASADSTRISQTLFRYSLAKMFSKQPAAADSASTKLARRMTLQSGREWSPEAASLLLNAAAALEARTRNTKDIASVIAFVDSVSTGINHRSASGNSGKPGKGRPGLKRDFAGLDTLDINNANGFNRIIAAVFGVSPEEAATVASFILGDPHAKKGPSADINKMVKGILSKQAPSSASMTVAHEFAATQEPEREKSRDALLALQFRPQESIRDSIAGHLPDLEQIYKKQLKLNDRAGGVVWVVFQVDAEGRVLSATVKSSAIANKQFQQLLEEYVRTIRFKAIPKDMKPMIFEFPFEFKSES